MGHRLGRVELQEPHSIFHIRPHKKLNPIYHQCDNNLYLQHMYDRNITKMKLSVQDSNKQHPIAPSQEKTILAENNI